jgi:hypothetical protein
VERDEPHGPLFWAALACGWSIMEFGVWTVLQRSGAIPPATFATWFVGLVLVHDLAIAPALSAVAAVLGPRLPRRVRGVVVAAAIVSGALMLLSLPPMLGNPAGNETLLPRNYVGGLAVALGVVWAAAAGAVLVVRGRARRAS